MFEIGRGNYHCSRHETGDITEIQVLLELQHMQLATVCTWGQAKNISTGRIWDQQASRKPNWLQTKIYVKNLKEILFRCSAVKRSVFLCLLPSPPTCLCPHVFALPSPATLCNITKLSYQVMPRSRS